MRIRAIYRLREWLIARASRLFLMRLALHLDNRNPDWCWADVCTDLGLGWDLGRLHEGLQSFDGGGKRCQDEARKLGTCWCGKMACPERMAAVGFANIEEHIGPRQVLVTLDNASA